MAEQQSSVIPGGVSTDIRQNVEPDVEEISDQNLKSSGNEPEYSDDKISDSSNTATQSEPTKPDVTKQPAQLVEQIGNLNACEADLLKKCISA
jgi:hypothetical protein